MKHVRLFAFLVATVGFCALVGSAAGAAIGHCCLFLGGLSGGLLGSCAAAWLGGRLGWIPAPATKATALGTVIGFLLAAAIAINTLHSPVGLVLSKLLIGIGGLDGLRFARNRSDTIK